MSYETLLFEVSDGVAVITLNRPDSANFNQSGIDRRRSLFLGSGQ